MKTVLIKGGAPLRGTVNISGSKNAALPIIFATILTGGISEIRRFPYIGDTLSALALLEDLGAVIEKNGDRVIIDTSQLSYRDPDPQKISAIRASTYLMGSCLARFGKCQIGGFGGCSFSNRPIDMHVCACVTMGGNVSGDHITANGLVGRDISFSKKSVGATINALLLGAGARGTTRILGYAREPHVMALTDFLRSAGADIEFTDREIVIRGRELHGGSVEVIGDMIEAGTYLSAAILTGGMVTVRGCDTSELSSFLSVIDGIGHSVSVTKDSVTVEPSGVTRPVDVVAEAYPGFPTDLQPIVAPVLAVSSGGSICDKVWSERYGYLSVLSRFGLGYELTSSGARIYGIDPGGASVIAPDLRGGMAAVLTALISDERSKVGQAELILRGYENPVNKLRSLGACIDIE